MPLHSVVLFPLVATIEFNTVVTSLSEGNEIVTVNLIRTGDLSKITTVCIRVTMLVDPAIIQRMCTIIYRINIY